MRVLIALAKRGERNRRACFPGSCILTRESSGKYCPLRHAGFSPQYAPLLGARLEANCGFPFAARSWLDQSTVMDDRLLARSAEVKALLPVAAATVALLGVVTTSSTAQAQNAYGANAQKYHIAVVDVSYIFKNHARHQQMIQSMKTEMTTTEAELKADGERIRQKEEQRNTFQAGSKEYKDLDEQLASDVAQFKLKMDRLRKSFMEREATMYYAAYGDVSNIIQDYAVRHDIAIVIRYNGDKADPNRREDVLREINKTVMFQNQIDITPDILAIVNRDAGGANPQMGRAPQPGSSIPR
jgi:Skp family chaperone for outer membrane proteins